MVAILPNKLTPGDWITYVKANAPAYGLDPAAVMAVAQQEGMSGRPGDGNTSFGPVQLHAGGELPASVWAQGVTYSDAWAWSSDGFAYALQRLANVAKGKQGRSAITAIVSQFERPQDPGKEITDAVNAYDHWLQILPGIVAPPDGTIAPPPPDQSGGGATAAPCAFTPTDCSQISGPKFGAADFTGIAQAVCGLQNGIGQVGQFFCNLGSLIHWFTVRGHWWQIAFVATGAVLVGIGIVTYLRPDVGSLVSQIGAIAA